MRLKLLKPSQDWVKDAYEVLNLHKSQIVISSPLNLKKISTPSKSHVSFGSKDAIKVQDLQELLAKESSDPKIFLGVDCFLLQVAVQTDAWTQDNLDFLKILCGIMVEMYRCAEEAMQRLAVKFLPSLLLSYFTFQVVLVNGRNVIEEDISQVKLSVLDAMIISLESCLLAIYNHCVLFEPVALLRTQSRFHLPAMCEGSLYHAPASMFGSNQTTLSNCDILKSNTELNAMQIEFKVCQEVNSNNIYNISMLLIRLYDHYIHSMDKASHEVFCRLCYQLSNLGEKPLVDENFQIKFTSPAHREQKPKKGRLNKSSLVSGAKQHANQLLHVIRKPSIMKSMSLRSPSLINEETVLENGSISNLTDTNMSLVQHDSTTMSDDGLNDEVIVTNESNITESKMSKHEKSAKGDRIIHVCRLPMLPEYIMVECLSPLYYILFNGCFLANDALNAFYMRAIYDGYAQVSLIVNAIKNSLYTNPSGAPVDAPMGIVVALSTTLSQLYLDDELNDIKTSDEQHIESQYEDTTKPSTSNTPEKAHTFRSDYSQGRALSLEPSVLASHNGQTETDSESLEKPVMSQRSRQYAVITNASFRTKKLPDDIPMQKTSPYHSKHSGTIAEETEEVGVEDGVDNVGKLGQDSKQSSSRTQRWRQTKL